MVSAWSILVIILLSWRPNPNKNGDKMNTTVSSELNHELLCRIAVSCMNFQNKGVFDAYLETGKTAVKEQGAMI